MLSLCFQSDAARWDQINRTDVPLTRYLLRSTVQYANRQCDIQSYIMDGSDRDSRQ